ncbi:MAG: ribosome maturation factor RimM [Cyclobacteriaceae bacterium]|nr:ribosome maturation factor RimM [Cyclobacteriaceae bacterium]
MSDDAYYQLGYVISKHGLKGEVNVFLDVDDPAYYSEMESVFVLEGQTLVPFFIDNIRINGNKAVVKFEGVDTIEEAERLQGATLHLPVEALPTLGEGQFYYHDIIGFMAHDKNLGEIGRIIDFYSQTKQDLLVIEHNEKEVLVPVNDVFVTKADYSTKTLYLNLPDGLLQIYNG